MAFGLDIGLSTNKVMMYVVIAIIGLFVSVGGFIIIWILRHDVIIRVHKKTASKTLVIEKYRARLVKDKELTVIKSINPTNKWLTNIKPPNNPYTWYIEGRKTVLNVYKQSDGIYQYITFAKKEGTEPNYMLIDEDMRLWTAMQLKETAEKYRKQTFMEKYGGVVSVGIIVVFFIVTIILIMRWIDGIIPQVISAKLELAKMVK